MAQGVATTESRGGYLTPRQFKFSYKYTIKEVHPIIQEQLNDKTIALSIKSGKLTSSVLAKAMRSALRKMRSPPKEGRGKMSLRQLSKQRSSLTNIEITEQNIGLFRKVARKYNIDFALKKDGSEEPPRWYVFFKARDTEALTAAFKEFSKKVLEKTEKKENAEKTKEKGENVKTAAEEKQPRGREKLRRYKAIIDKNKGDVVGREVTKIIKPHSR